METLATRISRDGPLNELDAVGWIIRLAKRIEGLHSLGVAHGAVSPECVLTAAVDRTSKSILADLRQTPSRVAYQSPERIAGGNLSPGDDVWALAATLYEALTGTNAFAGVNDAETRQKIAAASPAPLAVFDVGDDDLQHIIDSAFQRERSSRTTNAAAFRRALEEWHPDQAVRTLPPLDDEDPGGEDDDDEVRTLMRASPLTARHLADLMAYGLKPANQPPAPVAPPAAPAAPVERGRNPNAHGGVAPAPRPGAYPVTGMGAIGPASGAIPRSRSFDDEDEDQVMTVMREAPSLPAHLLNPGATPAPKPAAGVAAQNKWSPPGAPVPAPVRPGIPAPLPAAGMRPLAPPAAARSVDAATAARQLPLNPLPKPGISPGGVVPAPFDASPTLNTNEEDDEEDNARTLMREAPSSLAFLESVAAARANAARAAGKAPPMDGPSLGHLPAPGGIAAGPTRSDRVNAANPGSFGAMGLGRAASPTPFGPPSSERFSGSLPERNQEIPGAPAPVRSPGLMGAAGSAFGQQVQGHSPQNPFFTQPTAAYSPSPVPRSGTAPPTPFEVSASNLIASPMPDRSGRRGVIIAMVVAVLLAAGAMLFAARLGLLGSAPQPAPAGGSSAAIAVV